MTVQSVSVWILDHYTCACAVYEPMSILFGSLQHVGGLLASMQISAQLEGLPLHRALAQFHYSANEWVRLDEPLISDRLEGERWCICWRENSVSIVGTFSSE